MPFRNPRAPLKTNSRFDALKSEERNTFQSNDSGRQRTGRSQTPPRTQPVAQTTGHATIADCIPAGKIKESYVPPALRGRQRERGPSRLSQVDTTPKPQTFDLAKEENAFPTLGGTPTAPADNEAEKENQEATKGGWAAHIAKSTAEQEEARKKRAEQATRMAPGEIIDGDGRISCRVVKDCLDVTPGWVRLRYDKQGGMYVHEHGPQTAAGRRLEEWEADAPRREAWAWLVKEQARRDQENELLGPASEYWGMKSLLEPDTDSEPESEPEDEDDDGESGDDY